MSLAASAAPTIRHAGPRDQSYVANVLSDQLRRGGHDDTNQLTDRVLDSSRARVLVAERDHRILGWLAYVEIPRVRALLFVYVRRENRHQGIARALAQHAWPRAGQWVYAGLRGGEAKSLLQRFSVVEMSLEDLI